MEEIVQQLDTLHRLLPTFQNDIASYPDAQSLKFCLGDIYDDYLQHCVLVLENMTRNAFGKFIHIVKV